MILYGIPNCDTVKKAKKYLDNASIAYSFHDFRKDGLSAEKLQTWLQELGLDALTNKRSTTWKNLDTTTKETWNEQTALNIFLEQPTLIKRPVLETPHKTLIGFKEAEYSKLSA